MKKQSLPGSQGITLTADIAGSPPATSIILLHGGGQTRHSWDKLARRLARQGYHVISLDLRGHGDSDWAPDGDYSLDACAADVRAAVSALPGPPVLIGASVGGLPSWLWRGQSSGDLVKGLVLVDVVPRLEPEGVGRIVGFMRANINGFDSIDDVVAAVAAYLPHRPR